MANYLTFPMKVLGISQTYDGKTSHYPCSHGTPADYPIDIAGDTTGRSPFYCPCDEMKVMKIAGDVTGNNHANGAWLVSTSKVDFADGTRDYVTIKFIQNVCILLFAIKITIYMLCPVIVIQYCRLIIENNQSIIKVINCQVFSHSNCIEQLILKQRE